MENTLSFLRKHTLIIIIISNLTITKTHLKSHLQIQNRSIPSVIGKGGATINQIRDACGVKIDIPPREEVQYSDHVEIKVIGKSQESIDKAKDMIRNATERSYGQPRNDSYGSRRDRSGSIKRHHTDEIRDQSEHKRPFSPLRSSHASNPAPVPVSEPVIKFLCFSCTHIFTYTLIQIYIYKTVNGIHRLGQSKSSPTPELKQVQRSSSRCQRLLHRASRYHGNDQRGSEAIPHRQLQHHGRAIQERKADLFD